jgi:excisionase family DNA binding protein
MTTDVTPISRLLYTPCEAAHALGISRSSLYVLLSRGTVHSVRIGGSRRIPATALTAFIDSLDEDLPPPTPTV